MNIQEDGISRWRRVADVIRGCIGDGSIAGMLPPETELAARYGVNRHTVRRAISSLAAEGLVHAERGRGTYVHTLPSRIVYPIGERARFSENMLKQSLEPVGRLIRAERVAANAKIASHLQCRVGASLHRLDSLKVVDGVPLSRSTSFFPAERFPGIIDAYAETGSITLAFQREGVTDYRRQETRLTAERILPGDAELLSCPVDAIVLVSEAVDVDLDGLPIQTIRTKFLADRVELVLSNKNALAEPEQL